jgi:hypothetical protein
LPDHFYTPIDRTSDIVVIRAREQSLRTLIQDRSNLRQVIDFTKIPVKRRCDQRQLEDYPDTDLFALIRPREKEGIWRLLAIINCKVSFHARETETTFWGLIVRLGSQIPYVQVTEDANIYRGALSELGRSCKQSTKVRRLLEAFCNRVYLVKKYRDPEDPILDKDIETKAQNLKNGVSVPVFDDVNIYNHTQYCHSVRPLDDLIDDLCRWRAEILA